MDDGPLPGTRSRDESSYSYDLSNAVYGVLPSRATDVSPRRSCASSPARKKSAKRQSTADLLGISPRSISVGLNASAPTWLPQSERRTRLLQDQRMELHQTTCLNLNMASDNSTESDLWILPDFDDWELETEQQDPIKRDNEWAPLLRRAAKSNLERLRARLEGDGWAFVGGKYDEEKKALQAAASQSEESVDPEFDVVVL
ncbi:hypothetical protein IQ07DRAFT_490041, partial [Pyrenochaeta sp. DS3sAY3a]